jgi:hypothetical protein
VSPDLRPHHRQSVGLIPFDVIEISLWPSCTPPVLVFSYHISDIDNFCKTSIHPFFHVASNSVVRGHFNMSLTSYISLWNPFRATSTDSKSPSQQKNYHKRATGSALQTVKEHSKDGDLKIYGSCFWYVTNILIAWCSALSTRRSYLRHCD